MELNAKKGAIDGINWIKDWFMNKSGGAKGIVIGISGGKDSTVAASLCAKAIGSENVLGLLMPNGVQVDFEDSKKVILATEICSRIINIENIYNAAMYTIEGELGDKLSKASQLNLAPRLRMTVLYAVAQSLGYRVCGTSNLSEKYIGYTTKWGDNVSDFNPLGNLTSAEVVMIGAELGLPNDLIYKEPADGLSGKSDEYNFGFTYPVLNEYIRTGKCADLQIKQKISNMHQMSNHKRESIAVFNGAV